MPFAAFASAMIVSVACDTWLSSAGPCRRRGEGRLSRAHTPRFRLSAIPYLLRRSLALVCTSPIVRNDVPVHRRQTEFLRELPQGPQAVGPHAGAGTASSSQPVTSSMALHSHPPISLPNPPLSGADKTAMGGSSYGCRCVCPAAAISRANQRLLALYGTRQSEKRWLVTSCLRQQLQQLWESPRGSAHRQR